MVILREPLRPFVFVVIFPGSENHDDSKFIKNKNGIFLKDVFNVNMIGHLYCTK